MRATALLKQAFIRSLGKTASDRGVPLKDLVFATMSGKVTEAVKGKVLVGVAANGVSSTFEVPLTGVDAASVAELCAELLGLIESLLIETPTLTEPQLMTQLLASYPAGITYVRSDFGGMRL